MFPLPAAGIMRVALLAQDQGSWWHFPKRLGELKDISQPEEIIALCKTVSMDGAAVLAAIQTDLVKARLRDNTKSLLSAAVLARRPCLSMKPICISAMTVLNWLSGLESAVRAAGQVEKQEQSEKQPILRAPPVVLILLAVLLGFHLLPYLAARCASN